MIFKAIEYALGSKPAGKGSELTEYDKRMLMLKQFRNRKYKPVKGYQKNSKSRKVIGDIT